MGSVIQPGIERVQSNAVSLVSLGLGKIKRSAALKSSAACLKCRDECPDVTNLALEAECALAHLRDDFLGSESVPEAGFNDDLAN